jgi:hypothetical protein
VVTNFGTGTIKIKKYLSLEAGWKVIELYSEFPDFFPFRTEVAPEAVKNVGKGKK